MNKDTYERNQRLLNSFKLYTPAFVCTVFVMFQFLIFFDQGVTYSVVPEIREDPAINKVEVHPPASNNNNKNNSHSHNGTTNATNPVALSPLKSGIFSSIFMLGFIIGTPCFAALTSRFTTNRLIQAGMFGMWLGQVGCTFAPDYWVLILCRFVVGFFEAAASPFMLTIIDNVAPAHRKTLWQSIFLAMMPIATAAGMAAGGAIAAGVHAFGEPGWRAAYAIETPVTFLLGMLYFPAPEAYNIYKNIGVTSNNNNVNTKQNNKKSQEQNPDPVPPGASKNLNVSASHLRGDGALDTSASVLADEDERDDEGQAGTTALQLTRQDSVATDFGQDEHVPFGEALRALVCNNLDFLLLSLGYSMSDFMIMAYASWAVVMLVQGPLNVSSAVAADILGGCIAGCGLVGTIAGGVVVDWFGGVKSKNGISKCVGFGLMCSVIAFPPAIGSVMASDMKTFLGLFIPAVAIMTMNTAGLTAAILNVCDRRMRPYSMAICLWLMNTIGDAPSPLVVGAISKQFSGGCDGVSREECELMAEIAANMTTTSANEDDSVLTSAWWWHGTCKWIEASSKGGDSYCANTSQIPRAMICAVAACCILIPMWSLVVYRKWGEAAKDEAVQAEEDGEEEHQPHHDQDVGVPTEKTPLILAAGLDETKEKEKN